MASASNKKNSDIIVGAITLIALAFLSLAVGKYRLSIMAILSGDAYQRKVFLTLRLSRTLLGIVGGFTLGVGGFVFQTVFRNPLASPDMIGVASGASVGAAAGILLFGTGMLLTVMSFAGAVAAVLLSLGIAALDRRKNSSTVVLAGIAVHALAQTVLMLLKTIADTNNELASIEYWLMGGLGGIRMDRLLPNLFLSSLCLSALFLLHRQTLILSLEEEESASLGADVAKLRLLVLTIVTLSVACVISLTGLISFVGLLAPHAARLLRKRNDRATMLLSGLLGGSFLCAADILSRSVAECELPVSIFTSLIGAPFLIRLVGRKKV